MKKIRILLSAALCLCLLLSLACPAFTAGAAENCPIVYIMGQGHAIVNAEDKRIDPDMDELLGLVKENYKEMLETYAKDVVKGSYEDYADLLSGYFEPYFADMALDNTGSPVNGSRLAPYADWKVNFASTYYYLSSTNSTRLVYDYCYDWRLSPLVIASDLSAYIDQVLERTGARKVALVGRCLGANMIYAYLREYGYDKVASVTFFTPSLHGIGVINGLFGGDITIDPQALDNFINYYQNKNNITLGDDETTAFALTLIDLLTSVGAGTVGTDVVEGIYDSVKYDVVPRILLETYGSFPSFWAMMSPEYYEKARAFVFEGREEEYAEFLAQTDAYYELQKDMDEFLLEMNETVPVAVIAKYGFPGIPLSEDAIEQSDAVVSTRLQSLGAESAEYGKTLSESYIAKQTKAGLGDYVSPDKTIDGSTALFPERTWFIKDLHHYIFPDCANDIIFAFVDDPSMTVGSENALPRFLTYVPNEDNQYIGSLAATEETDELTDYSKDGLISSRLNLLFKWLKSLLTLLTKLIAGE